MGFAAVIRASLTALAIGAGVGVLAMRAPAADAQATFVQDGKAGFVVANIGYALSQQTAAQSGACPNGFSVGPGSVNDGFIPRLPDQDPAHREADPRRAFDAYADALNAPTLRNLCMNPAGVADPGFRTVSGANAVVDGIDLDGQDSHADGRAAPGTCAHDDFRGANGAHGIDNQFFRTVGCSRSFQPGESSTIFATEMLAGSWGILITLNGVDNIRNDRDVEVGFYANTDPIQLSPTREPLANATYAADQDPRFRATAHGRIVNGVLMTDPVDVRFHAVRAALYTTRPLRDARLRVTLGADGVMDGYLAGYTPVDALYNFQFGYRDATDRTGAPAPLLRRTYVSIGAANAMGYTCQGAYAALVANADGHRDPATGQCTSISTQYRIRAVPAFVVDAP